MLEGLPPPAFVVPLVEGFSWPLALSVGSACATVGIIAYTFALTRERSRFGTRRPDTVLFTLGLLGCLVLSALYGCVAANWDLTERVATAKAVVLERAIVWTGGDATRFGFSDGEVENLIRNIDLTRAPVEGQVIGETKRFQTADYYVTFHLYWEFGAYAVVPNITYASPSIVV